MKNPSLTINTKSLLSACLLLLFFVLVLPRWVIAADYMADHTRATESVLRSIPESAIQAAKERLHIAYFHSSHGSRVVSGMTGLKNFRPGDEALFDFSTGGTPADGKLDIDDHHAGGNDLSAKGGIDGNGYTQWFNETVAFLENPANSDINVVMWSWCNPAGHDHGKYISDMEELISRYGVGGSKIGSGDGHTKALPVIFIFMTGHPNGDGESASPASAYQCHLLVKQHCQNNNRFCLDYWDIETHGMDGTYYPHADDDGTDQAASPPDEFYKAWQADNPGEYFDNSCAHCSSDQEMTCNRKAYAAWWLWARVAGWSGGSDDAGNPGNEDEPVTSGGGTETDAGEGTQAGSAGCFLTTAGQHILKTH